MKDTNLKSGSMWGYITALIIAAMLCGTAIFISIQYKDSASIQAQSAKDSASTIKDGLGKLGEGICNGPTSSMFDEPTKKCKYQE